MTAPSVREALERARLFISTYRDELLRDFCTLDDERVPDRSSMDADEAEMVADADAEIAAIDAALAILSQPGEARERIARIIIGPRLPVRDECKFTLDELRAVRWSMTNRGEQQDALNAADAILAAGLVGDEAYEIKRLREDVKTLRRMVDNQARRWAEREAAIRADERERCAKIAESCFVLDDHWRLDIATAIRAGGER